MSDLDKARELVEIGDLSDGEIATARTLISIAESLEVLTVQNYRIIQEMSMPRWIITNQEDK